jgi:hypothetical protein
MTRFAALQVTKLRSLRQPIGAEIAQDQPCFYLQWLVPSGNSQYVNVNLLKIKFLDVVMGDEKKNVGDVGRRRLSAPPGAFPWPRTFADLKSTSSA